MKHPGPASASTCPPLVRPRARAAFLLALASLLFGGARLGADTVTPVFVNWPSSITNVWQSSQVTYTNSNYPTGLPVSNAVQVSASFVSNSISTNITGFSFNPNPGWGEGPPDTGDGSGPGAILLYFIPGTNPAISEPYTNTLQIVLSNPPGGNTSATNSIDIVITPPPPDYPVFTGSFSNQWSASASAQPINYTNLTGCRVASPASNSPTVFPVPDITNATQVWVRFVSNSLGQTSGLTEVALTPSNSYYATSNGFGIQGPYTGVDDLNLHPANPNPWSSANNTEAIVSAVGYSDGTNVWVSLNIVPGTNTVAVTNYLQLLAVQGDNSSTLNWTTNDLAVVVRPVVPFTPYLGITFTNDNYTNDPNLANVWLSFVQGTGTSIGYISNSSTNITWSAGNTMSDPVALSTVNANGGLAFTQGSSVIGYISYGAALGSLSNAPSPVDTTDASYQTPWVQFELTRGGTAAGLLAGDVGDLTFINEFSAPLYIKSYDTNGNLLQYSGFGTNSTATILQGLAAVTQTNSQAVITNNSGQFVRVIAPVSYTDLVGPYDNFHSYITNLSANNTVAYLQNYSGFTVSSNANSPNYNFTFTMTNHYHADGTMSIKGVVVATNTVQGGSTNFSGLKILYATNANSTVNDIGGAIYGANYASASNTIFFVNEDEGQTGGGSNWLAMSNYMVSVYTNPAHQTGSNAFYTVLSQMVGEVSSTIESGLAGSTNIVRNGSVSGVLGTNLSQNWWTMTNPLSIMRFAQTNPLNYDQYGDVIFYYSSNSVYNFSYNDRYNNAKPVVFANVFNGTNVGSWVIGVGAPVSTISAGPTPPPPPTFLSYSGWVGAWALSPTISGGEADPDNDGFDNNDEYAFGGNPTNPTPYLLNISGSNISYIGLTNAGTNYTVQNTTNLSTGPWTNYTATVTNATNQLNIPLPSYYHRKEFSVPLTPGTNNFYRVIFSNQ
jgi:hypothetical protein